MSDDFWHKAKSQLRPRKTPDRLKATRGEDGSSPPEQSMLYGPKKSFNYQAHALYVQWTLGEISANHALRTLRKLDPKRTGC